MIRALIVKELKGNNNVKINYNSSENGKKE